MSRQDGGKVDIDFTLALNNLTGKYFFGRDMIASAPDLVRNTYYWRWALSAKPEGLTRRGLGRLARWEVDARTRWGWGLGLFRPSRPLVFTDPREVVYADLEPYDVVLCHDLGPISHPELYDPGVGDIYRQAYDKIAAAGPFMLFVSNTTREAFLERFPGRYQSERVIYISPRNDIAVTPESVAGAPNQFILTVGAIGRRKNHAGALTAYAASGLHERGVSYVICGGPEPGAEAVMQQASRTPGVILTGYVGEAQLRWLYENALGFLLPSRLEGFGVPAMEAILHGAMPVVTRGGALNEVTGAAAILVDETPASIGEGLDQLFALSGQERASRLETMRRHIRQFDFAVSAEVWRRTLTEAAAAFDRAAA